MVACTIWVVDREDSRISSKWHCRAELAGRINDFLSAGASSCCCGGRTALVRS